MVIRIFCSDTVFVQLIQYCLILMTPPEYLVHATRLGFNFKLNFIMISILSSSNFQSWTLNYFEWSWRITITTCTDWLTEAPSLSALSLQWINWISCKGKAPSIVDVCLYMASTFIPCKFLSNNDPSWYNSRKVKVIYQMAAEPSEPSCWAKLLLKTTSARLGLAKQSTM